MSEKPPLTDDEIYDRLHAGWLSFANLKGETKMGDNTLKAARLALFTLQAGLVKANEEGIDHNPVIKDRDET
jgi:hypothetical protein